MVRTAKSAPAAPGAGSWLVTAAALIALIVAGFTVGMVAGVVWEEPDLVLAYISGETEEVSWSDVAASSDSSPGDAPVDPQVRREKKRAVAKQAPDVAAGPAGRLAVQVGAFGDSEAAERLAGSLREKGFPVYVSPGTKAGESRWRVRVGPLATREAAEKTADRLKQSEKLPTWILSEDAS